MSPRNATLLLALMLPLPAVAQDAEVPTIAVFDFTAFSLSPGEDAAAIGNGLASMIATELAGRPEVRVVDRQRVRELIESRQLAVSGRMDESDAIRLGQLLGAQYIVVGNIALEAKRARIDLRLLDVASGSIEKAARRQGSRDDFLAIVTDVADEFASGLKGSVRVAAAPVEVPVDAMLLYSRGLDYERRGMRGRAAEMYRQALDAFPDHEGAAAALGRVSERGGE